MKLGLFVFYVLYSEDIYSKPHSYGVYRIEPNFSTTTFGKFCVLEIIGKFSGLPKFYLVIHIVSDKKWFNDLISNSF